MTWATILAGGNGARLQPLTRALTGDDRPKQFVPLLDGQTLLAQTRRRIARNILPIRTVCVVTRDHRPFYRDELADVPSARMIEQPGSLGTAAAIAYSIARIRREDPKAVMGVFPVDHYYEDVDGFSDTLDATYRAALRHPSLVFLLASPATSPEAEFGWIEPGRPIDALSRDTFAVKRFWEKPSHEVARDLLARGCLWNTFVMIGALDAFRLLLHTAVPNLARAFDLVERNHDSEVEAVAQIYTAWKPTDFSRDVLMPHPTNAAVVRMPEVGWTDLGQPARVRKFLLQHGLAESPPSAPVNDVTGQGK
jgi:mannose-1-phosphate guanylyltransferase